MKKRVEIGAKPTNQSTSMQADAWVENRAASDPPEEAIKRLTLDIPESLHRRLKVQCAMHGTNMVKEIRALLLEKFPE